MTQAINIPHDMPMTDEVVALDAARRDAERVKRAAWKRYQAASRLNDANLANVGNRVRCDIAQDEYRAASRAAASAESAMVALVLAHIENR